MLLVDRLGRRRYQACFYVAAGTLQGILSKDFLVFKGLAAFSACQSLPYPMLAASATSTDSSEALQLTKLRCSRSSNPKQLNFTCVWAEDLEFRAPVTFQEPKTLESMAD